MACSDEQQPALCKHRRVLPAVAVGEEPLLVVVKFLPRLRREFEIRSLNRSRRPDRLLGTGRNRCTTTPEFSRVPGHVEQQKAAPH
jgi:hypothetical protein